MSPLYQAVALALLGLPGSDKLLLNGLCSALLARAVLRVRSCPRRHCGCTELTLDHARMGTFAPPVWGSARPGHTYNNDFVVVIVVGTRHHCSGPATESEWRSHATLAGEWQRGGKSSLLKS